MVSDNKLLKNRIEDYIFLAEDKGITSYTNFLNPSEQSVAMNILKRINTIKYEFEGGYPFAERRILLISPNNDWANISKVEVVAIKIKFSKHDIKYNEHRSILGAALGLGIRREAIGDIIINDNIAYLFTDAKMADFINNNLLTIGRATVSTTMIYKTDKVDFNIKDSYLIKTTVASLRMDCILAAALKTSRGNTTRFIQEDMVFSDWNLVKKATRTVEVGQIISIRKKGRICLRSIGNKSQKNRIWVEIECWL